MFASLLAMFAGRSGRWPAVRRAFLDTHLTCEACGDPSEEAHHEVPFHMDQELELDPDNLMALCRGCHFFIGHLKSWTSWNPLARSDAAIFLTKIRARP